jgi:hypothetical protein
MRPAKYYNNARCTKVKETTAFRQDAQLTAVVLLLRRHKGNELPLLQRTPRLLKISLPAPPLRQSHRSAHRTPSRLASAYSAQAFISMNQSTVALRRQRHTPPVRATPPSVALCLILLSALTTFGVSLGPLTHRLSVDPLHGKG